MAKIMIVEDETTIRELVANYKSSNLKRLEQPIFNDVLDDFQEENPQLVLMDINLPVYDEVLLVSKNSLKFLKVPIIFYFES